MSLQPTGGSLVDRVVDLCCWAESALDGDEAARVAAIRERASGPLRVAIAGRVKAGKSTLLNAILGELLAPTDAGECTRIITWYRHGLGYAVNAHLTNGTTAPLAHRRSEGTLEIDLDGIEPSSVEAIEVTVPTRRLEALTLIDTPGLEGLDEDSSRRTSEFLGISDEGASDVDAVIYLVRHFHRRDAEFLEAFHERIIARPSPVNAIAVLSRADELGAARLDALDSAAAIAGRYAEDPLIRRLCATVLPLAGLLAESGRTLSEAEFTDLRTVARTDPDELASMLLSVDRFCDERYSVLEADRRRSLLQRFGLFGVRFAVDGLLEGRIDNADQLARVMVEASGIGPLFELLDRHLGRRARALKARSALVSLRTLTLRSVGEPDPSLLELRRRIEELEANAHELDELRLVHLVLSRSVEFGDAQSSEIETLLSGAAPAVRLGFDQEAEPGLLAETILQRIESWRRRLESPLAEPAMREACSIVVRSYEALHAEVAAADG